MNDDLISRQALLDDLGISEKTRKWGGDHSGYDTMMLYEIQDVIESQASVTLQEPKTGHWILDETDNSITCDKCGCLIWANDISNGEAYYCPNCGCRMVEPQERSDKE